MNYQHILAPVDCTDDALRSMQSLLRYASAMPACKVTLAAAVTHGPTPEVRQRKRHHAQSALDRLHGYLKSYGLHTDGRIVEADDPAVAFVAESNDYDEQYDVIVLSPYQARSEDPFEVPCAGSLADRIGQRTELPVLILPLRRETVVL